MKLIFTKAALVSALLLSNLYSNAQDNSAWSEVNTKQNETYFNQTYWKPKHYKQFVVNTEKIYKQLEAAPAYNSAAKTKNNYVVALPNAEGSFDEYYLEEVVIMEKALSAKYPEIKTYKGTSVKNPANQIRCSKTSLGFNAYIFGENTSYITTINRNNEQYIVYNKKDIEVTGNKMTCSAMDEVSDYEGLSTEQKNNIQKNIGTELRTYRLALACTKEYTNYHGGTVNGALAAMVTSVNRVNGVYEKEIDVSLTLVANTDLLICTNASTFTYTNNDGSTMLGENQSRVNSIIGAANYDIGHVFSTGGGGVAQQAMCKTAKARGVTGSSNPENDPFDIDYVAHEMGHQFGADHTFNSTTGSCAGNRVSFTAFEPGSGTTIMPYAGICGATNDIQPHSDAYFHSGSFDQIRDYIIFDVNSCGVKTPIANSIPVINNNSSSYTIPVGAKFRLGCDATDADGDVLTYCWEEMDLGPSGNWNVPSGNAPVFRSFNPTTNNFRYFPKQSTMLGGAQIKGEVMPNYARSMTFRCTVRDNKGGVTYTPGNTTVNTVVTSSPFLVTTQNVNGITYNGGDEIQVDWDVAGTDAAPINASNVNIFLSIDGGQSFPYKIAENIANVGTGAAIIPFDIESTQARLIVEGADNVFFDVNDNDFEIVLVPSSVQEKSAVSKGINVFPNPTNGEVNIQISESVNEKATLTITDIVGKQIMTKNIIIEKNNTIDLATQQKGVYFVKIDTKDKSYLKKIVLQ